MTEETKPEIKTTHPIMLEWQVFRPDIRQYKQQSTELILMDVQVAVDVPIELFYRLDNEICILKPEGMKFVQDQIEKLYESETKPPNIEWETKPETKDSKSDGWDNEPIEWESETSSSTKKDDVVEKDESIPDTEEWNEETEKW